MRGLSLEERELLKRIVKDGSFPPPIIPPYPAVAAYLWCLRRLEHRGSNQDVLYPSEIGLLALHIDTIVQRMGCNVDLASSSTVTRHKEDS